jgi:hypothetical protein
MTNWEKVLIESAPDRDLAERVRYAPARLLDEDVDLLKADANERSISHRFAVYLEKKFPEWDVD